MQNFSETITDESEEVIEKWTLESNSASQEPLL